MYEENRQLNGENALTQFTLSNKLNVLAGSTRSFSIWIDGAIIKYKLGTVAGAVADSDDFVNISVGLASLQSFLENQMMCTFLVIL
jgi:hypothetical protein